MNKTRQSLLNSFLARISTRDAILSPETSRILLILNVGYTGSIGSIDHLQLQQLLDPLRPKHILMPLSCPFSILVFNSIEESIEAELYLNNKIHLDREIFTEYLALVPTELFPLVLKDSLDIQQSIPGLFYIPNFISIEEESNLLDILNGLSYIQLNYRQVKHYGYPLDYSKLEIPSSHHESIPSWIQFALQRYSTQFPTNQVPNQLTINSYTLGDGIGPHMDSDTLFGPVILVLSLESDIVIEFLNKKVNRRIHVLLEKCSLLVMSKEARYEWLHAIRPRKVDSIDGMISYRQHRFSLTFRNVKNSQV